MKHRFVLLIVIASVSSPAAADPQADAKRHMDRAAAHHAGGRYRQALESLNRAYELDPNPSTLYSIAQVNVKLDRCDVAITFYEKFLATSPAAKPTAAARDAIAACKKLLPPRSPEAVSTPTPEPRSEEPKPEPPPPPPAEPAPAPEPAAAPVRDPAPAVAMPEPSPPRDAPAGERAWYKDPIGGVLLVAGVASSVGSVVLFRAATRDNDDAAAAADYGTSEHLVARAQRKRTYAVVAAGGGVALIGAAVVRYIFSARGGERAVAIGPTADGVEIAFGGRF